MSNACVPSACETDIAGLVGMFALTGCSEDSNPMNVSGDDKVKPSERTTIVDVADPRHPRTLATIDLPEGWHSHKVRVCNGIMVVNHEKLGQTGPSGPGFGSRRSVGQPTASS